MVDTVIDPIRMPTVTLSQAEIEEIEQLMAAGSLPPDWLDRHFDAVDANVFGADAPKDRHGNRKEQGRGSAANMTQQSIDAYKKWGKGETDFAENLKRMEAQLAETNQRREANGTARRGRKPRK